MKNKQETFRSQITVWVFSVGQQPLLNHMFGQNLKPKKLRSAGHVGSVFLALVAFEMSFYQPWNPNNVKHLWNPLNSFFFLCVEIENRGKHEDDLLKVVPKILKAKFCFPKKGSRDRTSSMLDKNRKVTSLNVIFGYGTWHFPSFWPF